jgi:hypothetical protein
MGYVDGSHLNVDYVVNSSIDLFTTIKKDSDRLGTLFISSSSKKNEILNVFKKNKLDNIEDQKKQNLLSLEDLKKSKNLDDVLKLAKTFFSERKHLSNRLEQLISFYNEEEEEEEGEISVESLKSMLVFFSEKVKFNSPSITLSEDGIFQVNWRKDNLNLITLRFKNENSADFLIFESSQYTDKPEISNGSKTVFKLVEDIKKLNLNYLIEDKFNV